MLKAPSFNISLRLSLSLALILSSLPAPLASATNFELMLSPGQVKASGIDHYGILGVKPNASLNEIQKAGRHLPSPLVANAAERTAMINSHMANSESLARLANMYEQSFTILRQVDGALEAEKFAKYFNEEISKSPKDFSLQAAKNWAKINTINRMINELDMKRLEPQIRQLVDSSAKFLSDPEARNRDAILKGHRKLYVPRMSLRHPIESVQIAANNIKANARGETHVRTEDPEGRRQSAYFKAIEGELKSFSASEAIASAKQGFVRVSGFTAMLMGFLYAMSLSQLWLDYNQNPDAVAQYIDRYVNWIGVSSLGSFFLISGSGQLTSQYLSNLKNLRALVDKRYLFATNPERFNKLFHRSIGGLTLPALTSGVVASLAVFEFGHQMSACRELYHEVPMSAVEKMNKKKECDQTFREVVTKLAPNVVTSILAITSVNYAMNKVWHTNRTTYEQAKANGQIAEERVARGLKPGDGFKSGLPAGANSTQKLQKGAQILLRIKNGAVVGASSIVILGAYVIVGHILGEAVMSGMEMLEYDRPRSNAEDQLRKFLKSFHQNGFQDDDSKVCVDVPNRDQNANQTCGFGAVGPILFESFDNWRQKRLEPVVQTLFSWSMNSGNAFNMYDAAKLFYSKVVQQVNEKRRLENNRPKLDHFSGLSLGTDAYVSYALDPVPLFRSSPLFGLIVEPPWQGKEPFENLHADQKIKEEKAVIDTKLEGVKKTVTEYMKSAEGQEKQFVNSNKDFSEILTGLMSGELKPVVNSLIRLHELTQREPDICKLNPKRGACPYSQFAEHLKDPRLFELYDIVTHERKRFPYLGSFRQRNGNIPKGPYPLGPGGKFLQNFALLARQNNIDEDWYPEKYMNQTIKSMAHYLMLTSVCGQDPNNPRFNRQNIFGGGRARFEPPRLPVKDMDKICPLLANRDGIGEALLDHGFSLEKNDNIANYADLLYQKLQMTTDQFENWWKQRVFPVFQRHLSEMESEFDKAVLNKSTKQALTRSDRTFWYELPKGVLQGMDEEMNLYFTGFLDPLAQAADLNPNLAAVKTLSDDEKKQAKLAEYSRIRQQFLSHWQRAVKLAVSKDQKEMEKVREGLQIAHYQLQYFFQTVPEFDSRPNVLDLSLTQQQVVYATTILDRIAALQLSMPAISAFTLSTWLVRDQKTWDSWDEEPLKAPTPYSNPQAP